MDGLPRACSFSRVRAGGLGAEVMPRGQRLIPPDSGGALTAILADEGLPPSYSGESLAIQARLACFGSGCVSGCAFYEALC